MLPSVVLQADWKQTQERMKYRNTSLTAISKVVYRFDDTMLLKHFFYIFWWKQNMFRMKHHQSPETSFVFIKIYQICIYKMNFKSIVWFIKATSYSVLLRSLGNTSKVIMSVSLIRHTTYCYFSFVHQSKLFLLLLLFTKTLGCWNGYLGNDIGRIAPVSRGMHTLWLVENCVISRARWLSQGC